MNHIGLINDFFVAFCQQNNYNFLGEIKNFTHPFSEESINKNELNILWYIDNFSNKLQIYGESMMMENALGLFNSHILLEIQMLVVTDNTEQLTFLLSNLCTFISKNNKIQFYKLADTLKLSFPFPTLQNEKIYSSNFILSF